MLRGGASVAGELAVAQRPAPTATAAFEETDKLHQLLGFALDDFIKILKNPRYRIDMSVWHYPYSRGTVCTVNLIGAVLANRYCADPDLGWADLVSLGDFPVSAHYRLVTLDLLRCGKILAAYREFVGLSQNAPGASAAAGLERVWLPFLELFVSVRNKDQATFLLGKLRDLENDLRGRDL